jgi:polyhydroxyalkanoate synthesis regulator phasin
MKKWLLAVGGVAAVAVIGAGVVMAQTPGTSSGKTFLDRVAAKLGIDTPKLQNAIKGARNDQIDEAVQNGDLTQKQADALKQKIDQSPNGGGFGEFGFGHMRGAAPFGKHMPFDLMGAADKLAGFLGISQDQLQTELSANGASLASVAQAHGKSRDDLKTFIKDTAKSTLDDAVKNGDMTQSQEDSALSVLDSNLDTLIDAQWPGVLRKGFGFFGGGRGHGHGFGAPPSGSATPGASDSGIMEGLSRS